MKRRFPLLLLPAAVVVLLAAGCGGGGGGGSASNIPETDVAVVGTDHVTRAQLDELVQEAERSYKAQKRTFPKPGSAEYRTLQNQALSVLVQRSELSQEAKKLGVSVTEKKVEAQLVQVKKQCCGGSEKRYQAQLKANGVTDRQVRDGLRAQLLSSGLYAKITAKLTVSDAQVKQYYDQHPEQYSQPASRTVRHILVKDRTTADKIYGQLKNGADFAKLAKQYSQDTFSKNQGGKLTISKGQTVKPFDQVAFALKTNGLSKPVKTQYGWHVIQALTAVKPKQTKALTKQVKESIRQTLLKQTKDAEAQKWLAGVTKEFAAKTKYAAGFAPPPSQTATTTP